MLPLPVTADVGAMRVNDGAVDVVLVPFSTKTAEEGDAPSSVPGGADPSVVRVRLLRTVDSYRTGVVMTGRVGGIEREQLPNGSLTVVLDRIDAMLRRAMQLGRVFSRTTSNGSLKDMVREPS